MSTPQTLIEAVRQFADPDVCLKVMSDMRWPNGVACPTCGSTEVRFISTRRLWECKSKHPRKQFSVKVGTIFEDSPISLDKWLVAMWLIANAKNGISSYELKRDLGVTQTTAWFMLQRIRLAMQDDGNGMLGGTVEVDETFIGGKARFMHRNRQSRAVNGRGPIGKTAVMGLLERHGPDGYSKVRATVIKDRTRKTVGGVVSRNVEAGAEVITDEHAGYDELNQTFIHGVINHAETYVQGKIHTNGIENFWALLKRAIKGTYVSVEPFHLFRYVDEESFRYNNRKGDDSERFGKVASGIVGKRLTYKELIGSTTPA